MNILCLGTSYTARYAVVNFNFQHDFYFLSRKPNYYPQLKYFDSSQIKSHGLSIDFILDTIPPPAKNSDAKNRFPPYKNEVDAVMAKQRIPYIYISSTAVFPADPSCHTLTHSPVCFNEKDIPVPDTPRGIARLQMEECIKQHYSQVQILRSTGIYGPGRSILEKIRSGNLARTRIGNRFTSRIHVHDLLRLAFALACQKEGRDRIKLVHAVDQDTAPYSEVFNFIQNKFQITIPSGAWQSQKPRGRIIKSIYAEKLLEGQYCFPTYKEGFC